RIHIVDLDGAFSGNQKNLEGIKAIRQAVDVALEVGGGIRTMEDIERLLSLGIDKVILGTVAIKNPELLKETAEKYPEKILVGIDAKDGRVAIKGWVEVTERDALEFAKSLEDLPLGGIIYTDIKRDGMLTGPNIEATSRMVENLRLPVIASGGISSIDDIKALKTIQGLFGAITGKALYSGAFSLQEAIKVAKS
ncbi:MAG: 1-(5-phosphoribosyl)-5-[(5-phosphoribosylamino)methylideneamino] imidazole-4-carboxamide isomerase, partial [Nitrospirae bacterium]